MPDGSEAASGRTSVQELLREARERRLAWRREHEARSAEALLERQAEVRRMTGAEEREQVAGVAMPAVVDEPAGVVVDEVIVEEHAEAPADESVVECASEPEREAAAVASVPVVAEAAAGSPGLRGVAPRLRSLWMGAGAMKSSSGGAHGAGKPAWAVARDGEGRGPTVASAAMPAATLTPAQGPVKGPAQPRVPVSVSASVAAPVRGAGDGIRFRQVAADGALPSATPAVPSMPSAPAGSGPGVQFRRTDGSENAASGPAAGNGDGRPAWARRVGG